MAIGWAVGFPGSCRLSGQDPRFSRRTRGVETALAIDGISQAVVVARNDSENHQRLVGYVVAERLAPRDCGPHTRGPRPPTWCRRRSWWWTSSMTANGKIDQSPPGPRPRPTTPRRSADPQPGGGALCPSTPKSSADKVGRRRLLRARQRPSYPLRSSTGPAVPDGDQRPPRLPPPRGHDRRGRPAVTEEDLPPRTGEPLVSLDANQLAQLESLWRKRR